MRRGFRNVVSWLAISVGLSLLAAVSQLALVSGTARAEGSTQMSIDLDAPGTGAIVTNGDPFFVGGWAVAPGAAGSGVTSVDVFLDGGPTSGTYLGSATLGTSRQDVASAFHHPEWSSSGYNFTWIPRDVSAGVHTLSVVAVSDKGETATQSVQVQGCGCGLNFQPTYAQPYVQRFGPDAWLIDTGGPGLWVQRDDVPYFLW
jgi:Bacterial Ig domain